jgi:hypothetical protein
MHRFDDLEQCEGRDPHEFLADAVYGDEETEIVTLTPGSPSMRLWTIWDHYQSSLIDGLA